MNDSYFIIFMDSFPYKFTDRYPEFKKTYEEFSLNLNPKSINERYSLLDDKEKVKLAKMNGLTAKFKELNDSKGWIKLKEGKGFGSYYMDGDGALINIKSVGIFPFNAMEMAAIIADNEYKKKYDKLFKDYKLIDINPLKFMTYHLMFHGKFPAKQRDFACVMTTEYDAVTKSFMLAVTSIQDERIPKNSDYERGYVTFAFYEATPEGSDSCKLTYISNVDLAGSIPKFIANWASKKQASLAENIFNNKFGKKK